MPDAGVLLTVKTLNEIGNQFSPIPVGKSRKPETCSGEWDKVDISRLQLREVVEKTWRSRRGAQICCLGTSDWDRWCTIHSWMNNYWNTSLAEGIFLLLAWEQRPYYPSSSHKDSPHPKATCLPDKQSCEDGLTFVLSSHIHLSSQPECSVSGEVSASGRQETEGKRLGARGWARWQHQLLSRSCVF